MTTELDRVYRLNDSLRWCAFEDGGVVFDLESRGCGEINGTAARIIGYLGGEKALGEIIEMVRSEFEPPPATLENDLIDFIEDLVRKGWLDVR